MAGILSADDVQAAAMRLPSVGVRFSMDVAEDALARMGREAIPHIALDIAKRVVYDNQDLIRSVITDYLRNREWCEPIIEDEIRKTVRAHVRGMFELIEVATTPRGSRD
jgi:hypothetical protein